MKYHNKKVSYEGMEFDSRKEMQRYNRLRSLEKAGMIKDLERQVKFELIPAQYEPDVITASGKAKRGKIIERSCVYIADFVYFDNEANRVVVEDTKGFRTKDYIIKRKLMLQKGFRIKEV